MMPLSRTLIRVVLETVSVCFPLPIGVTRSEVAGCSHNCTSLSVFSLENSPQHSATLVTVSACPNKIGSLGQLPRVREAASMAYLRGFLCWPSPSFERL